MRGESAQRKFELRNKLENLKTRDPLGAMLGEEYLFEALNGPDESTRGAVKCPRCWRYHLMAMNFDYLCDWCCRVLLDDFPNHESVPHILEAYAKQREKY